MNNISVRKSLETIDKIIEFLNNGYTVLLESDVVGLMMHFCLSDPEIENNQVHIDTRIKQSKKDSQKIDLAIGEICKQAETRPRVDANAIYEFKSIPESGFNDKQKRIRFGKILEDILKIQELKLAISRWIVVYDGVGYFDEERRGQIIEFRDKNDEGIEIVFVQKENDNWVRKYYPSLQNKD
jgi:hypothetical protein